MTTPQELLRDEPLSDAEKMALEGIPYGTIASVVTSMRWAFPKDDNRRVSVARVALAVWHLERSK